jgi:AraC family transcriptional regulator of adaptative response / DNA-3-methyladenine glycosylase II
MPDLDPDRCYSALVSRDARFDGWFVTGVRTTGIYCRPSCPAITPKRGNVEFHRTAAAAQQRGFRACKRCRPDATPGSPEWNTRHDVVGRAMRLIADGVVERDGVTGLASSLGYSERHLNRLFTDELGAGPLAVARARRAHTARTLIETTDLAITEVAFAAGFSSVRQFNETVREVFASSPSELRRGSARSRLHDVSGNGADAGGCVQLRLPVRAPFAGGPLLAFLGARAIPGIEAWDGIVYRRTMALPDGPGVVALRAGDDHVSASLRLEAWTDLAVAVQRLRRLLDLDADPVAVDGALAEEPGLSLLAAAVPGRRAPASVDPYETAVRAVVGQQVSVAGARTVAARIVEAVGEPLGGPLVVDDEQLTAVFPGPARLRAAPDTCFSMPAARRDTVRRIAAAVDDGVVRLDPGVDVEEARAGLLALKGIGPWTADYVAMRGLGDPDRFLPSDLGVRHALGALGLDPAAADRWAPWRSYAVHHLWASLDPTPPATHES